jgi:thiol-disulfide isomerase/thioredoxin
MEDSNNPNINDIYLVPTNMTAFISYNHFKDMKMTGSKTNDSFDSLKLQWSKVNKQSDSAEEIFSRIESKYIGTHPNSFVSARELAYYKRTWKLDKVQQLYNNLNDKVKNSWSGKDVKVAITEIEENSPGKKAKDFRTTDVNGKVIDLSNFRNGYVLLDFWASWCEPCRKSTPHLIQLYKKYRNRGFSVIGVSVDHDVNAWKKAIQQDSINIWYNILSTSINPKTSKDSKSVNDKFGVKVFPTKILIDKNGTIIGRFTGADDDIELDKKLSTIFRG